MVTFIFAVHGKGVPFLPALGTVTRERHKERGKARPAQKGKWLKAAARSKETKVLAGDVNNEDAYAPMANRMAMA